MPAYLWITVAAAAAFVFWIGWGRGWLRSVRYSFARARHVIELTQSEPWPAPEYGSMVLAEERKITPAGFLRGLDGILSSMATTNLDRGPDDPYDPDEDEPFRWLPAPTVDPAPWLDRREPTAAEVAASRAAHGYIPELDVDEAIERASESDRLTVALEKGWLEPPCPHEYTPNATGTHEWCQICDSVRVITPLPEIVLPDAGGWISGPCLDDPGPGDGESSLASSGPDQVPLRERLCGPEQPHEKPAGTESAGSGHPEPSRWLADQLEILHAWSAWQQQKAVILA